jgi:rhodanese-related sulfurtransferase
MTWLYIVDALIIAFFAWYFGSELLRKARYKDILLDNEAFAKGRQRGQIVDVRNPEEFASKHIKGARNVPYAQFKEFGGAIRKDLPVYLYEQKNATALKLASKMKKQGYTEVYVLKGGMNKWDGDTKSRPRY